MMTYDDSVRGSLDDEPYLSKLMAEEDNPEMKTAIIDLYNCLFEYLWYC